MKKTPLLLCALLFLNCTGKISELLKKAEQIDKVNNTIIYDLFLNYELSEKNRNLSAIIDYLPSISGDLVSEIKMESSVAGNDEITVFTYNETGNLSSIKYQVDRGDSRPSRYIYELFYNSGYLTHINIADKRRIDFKYDSMGRIASINRRKNEEVVFEYTFEYLPDSNKADITLYVVQSEDRRISNRPYYVSWDSQSRLDAYNFDVYSANSYSYNNDTGTLSAIYFDRVDSDNNKIEWEYEYDDSGNWIKKSASGSSFSRIISYK